MGIAVGAMAAIAEGGDGEPTDLAATAIDPPTELDDGEMGTWIEEHQDLWDDPEAVIVARPDPKRKKIVVMPVKLATPTGVGSAVPTPRAAPMITEYAQVHRRTLSRSLFPARWGSPPFESEARAAWIYNHCVLETRAGDVDSETLIDLQAKFRLLAILARRFGA